MTIIDILVKHANGDKLPKKFKYGGVFFKLNEYGYYTDEDGDSLVESIALDLSNLNEEVEIIEDTEKINVTKEDCKRFIEYNDETGHHKYTIRLLDEYFANKINYLIDEINKLKK